MSGGVLELAWRRYTTQLERRPLVTKVQLGKRRSAARRSDY